MAASFCFFPLFYHGTGRLSTARRRLRLRQLLHSPAVSGAGQFLYSPAAPGTGHFSALTGRSRLRRKLFSPREKGYRKVLSEPFRWSAEK
jgi:hypothetical protein